MSIKTDDLVYFEFGISIKDLQENKDGVVLDACIEKAYNDLNRTMEYYHSTSEIAKKKNKDGSKLESEEIDRFNDKKEKFKKQIRKSIKNHIKKYPHYTVNKGVDRCLLKEIKCEFDKWHYVLCSDLVMISKQTDRVFQYGKHLTYGQAQKWVNMTIKYCYILGIGSFNDALMHVPIDDYILSAIAKEGRINSSIDIRGLGITVSSSMKPWSRISNYNDYLDLQLAIRKNKKLKKSSYTPIGWESKAWIAASKKARKGS